MGPLVYFCRWRGSRLRLHGRDDPFVWGQLATSNDDGEQVESFRFNTQTWELFLGEGDMPERLQLDELGVVVPPEGRGAAKTSVDVGP